MVGVLLSVGMGYRVVLVRTYSLFFDVLRVDIWAIGRNIFYRHIAFNINV
jgi:hypothetical protein